jgi:DNA-binding CsgD family transcriptional regulator
MNPIVVNRAALEVLGYPQKPDSTVRADELVLRKIRSVLLARAGSGESLFVGEFRSGKRLYSCRAFRVDAHAKGHEPPAIALLIERGASDSFSAVRASEKYHLTSREQQVLLHLCDGLTSKQIAERMTISTNTVKAFLRLMMIKMDVSTRAGIVGKAVTIKS